MSVPCPEVSVLETATDRLIEEAVAQADLRVLLMVVFHLTGDRKWLDYRPSRDVKLVADEDAGLPEAAQEAIRAAAVDLLSRRVSPAISNPDESLMTEMMRVCLGEDVPAEYAPLMREEMGFASRDVSWSEASPRVRHHVAIVGAGVSGIALAARLERLGIDYVIVERNSDVGGVWWENQYPGAGVDTPSHAYSFSFVPPHRWPHFFSARDEIYEYLRKSAVSLGVIPRIRFNTAVTSARWDENAQQWLISLDTSEGAEQIQASIFVSATGQFGEPSSPEVPGMETFAGPIFHSAEWPEGFEVSGKQIAVIGTGASAMQIVPTVASEVAGLTVYQRSAQWARPVLRYHDELGEAAQWLMQNAPFYAAWFRFTCWWRYSDGLLSQLHRDPEWPHPERSINLRNDRHREEMTAYIQHKLRHRPDLVAKAVPDYPPFAKRILLDNGWYDAIARENVELVVDNIARIVPDGVETADGTARPADAIVFATGFRLNPLAARLNVTGRDGQRLIDAFNHDDPKAYLGISVAGFPNFFMMAGPNTGLAHGGSAVFQAESQARYITGMIVEMSENGIASCEVKTAVQDQFVELCDSEHEKLIWTHPNVSNYYKNRSGRIFSAMPFRLVDYWRMTHEPDLGSYELKIAE